MSSPEKRTDRYLDDVLQGNNPQADLPADEANLLNDLVTHYQADSLSIERKNRMWQKAQIPVEKAKRQPAPGSWIWRSVAGLLLLMLGLSGGYGYFAYQQYADSPEARGTIANYPDEPLFAEPPLIFEYGGYARIGYFFPAANLMREANMEWVGMVLSMEAAADIENIREQIDYAHENGFKVFISLRKPDGLMDFDSSNFPGVLAEFAGELALAGADAIEIWSGGNIGHPISRKLLGTASYADLLNAVATAIREANPDTLIISGAPAPTGAETTFPGQIVNDDNFLRELVELNAFEDVDCIGMHYVEGIVPPAATDGDSRDDYYTRYLPAMLEAYRSILNETNKPLCLTEIGYVSLEGMDVILSAFQWAAQTSREEQAQWTAEAMEYLAQQPDVALAMVWHVDYNDYTDPEDPTGRGYSLTFPVDG